MTFKPFTAQVELPREVREQLHQAQIFLSLAPARPDLLRIAIVPAEERWLPVSTIPREDPDPDVYWLPADFL